MNDERSAASHLPTWIPEGLLIAEKERAARAEAEKPADQTKWRVADRVRSAVRNAEDVQEFPNDDSKLEKIRQSIRVSPQVSAGVVLSKMGFSSESTRRNAFLEKRVLDVGGGFSGLAPLVSRYWAKVVVADPVFFEADTAACFEKDLDTIRKLVKDLQDRVAKGEGETQRIKNAMERNLSELEKVYTEMFFWRGYDAKRFPSISRLAAFAENLVGLPDSSQDFVFATNVVGKPTLDVERFHSELLRVLSPGGHVYVLDYDDPSALSKSSELESLLRRTRQTHSFSDGWHRIIIS